MAGSPAKSAESKATNIDFTPPRKNQFSKYFTDGRRVFKAVAGTWRSDNDLRVFGVEIYDEVGIRSRRIKTGRCLVTSICTMGSRPNT